MPIIEYKLQGDSKSLVGATDSAAGSMGKATTAATALTAGAVALGTAYLKLVTDTVKVVDQVNTLSKASGLSAETVNGLRLAAKATGKEITDLVPKNLAKNMMAARDGSKAMAKAFEDMEVETENADGSLRDANEVFAESIEWLSGMENQTEAAALAAVTMGKQGRELLSAFDNREGFERFVDLGNEFGTKTGPAAVAAASQWQAATANLSLAFEDMGADVLDVLGGSGAVAKGIDNFALGLIFMSEFAAEIAGSVIGNFKAIGGAIGNLLTGNFEEAAASAAKFETDLTYVNAALEAATEEAFKFHKLQVEGREAAAASAEEAATAIEGQAAATRDAIVSAADLAAFQREAAEEARQAAEDEIQFLHDIAEIETELAAKQAEAKVAAIADARKAFDADVEHVNKQRDDMLAAELEREEALAMARDIAGQTAVQGLDLLLAAQIKAAEASAGASKKEQRAKERAIKRTFAAQQSLAIGSIVMDAAKAVLALIPGFAFLGPGAPAAAAGVVTPLAAIQTAAVLSAEAPSFHDGTDEVRATLRANEAVLSQRGAEAMGRDNIEAANRGTGTGGGNVSQIVFQGRVLDQMVSSVIQSGGQTARLLAAGRPPAGTLDPFGGI